MQSEIKLNYALAIQRRNLLYMGFWPQGHHLFWRKMTYAMWSVVSFAFIQGFYVLIQAINVLVNLGNIDEVMASLFLLLTNILLSFKIMVCIYRSSEFDQMIGYSLKTKMQAESDEEIDLVKRYEKSDLRSFLFYILISYSCIIPWALVPVLEGGTKSENRLLPLAAWYPYNKNQSPAYEISYIHQVVAIALDAYCNISIDSVMTNLMGLATFELEMLMIRLKLLAKGDRTLRSLNSAENFNDSLLERKGRLEAHLYKELCECVNIHEHIYSITRKIQNCIGPIVFAQFSTSSLILCATLYQIAMLIKTGITFMAAFGTTMYLASMLFELYLYCKNGNDLLFMSSKVAEAANECNWYNCSKSFCATLRFLMMRALRPIKITAGSFIDLSLETFMTIVKASYSFFTLVQNSQ